MKQLRITGIVAICMGAVFGLSNCEKPHDVPLAEFSFSPTSGAMDTLFIFDASRCSDPQDDSPILEVRWDWEADGIWDTDYTVQKIASHRFADLAAVEVVLEVKNSRGMVASQKKPVSIYDSGAILGGDRRMCACCGGWFIGIGQDTLRFDQPPSSFQRYIETAGYPLNVKVKWAKKNPRCMMDQINVYDLILMR